MRRALLLCSTLLLFSVRSGSAQQHVHDESAVREEPRTAITVPAEQQQKIGLRVAKIERGRVEHTIRTVGTVAIDQSREAHVHTRSAGWIEDIRVSRVGQRVRKGETLCLFYSPDLVAIQDEYLAARGKGTIGAEVSSAALAHQDSQMRLLAVIAGAAILMLLILQAAFGAWRLAFLVMLAMPAAAAGGVVLSLATGELMTLGALAGFILVIALTVRHAIALVARFPGPRENAALRTMKSMLDQPRLVPIATTLLATAAFALPFIALGDVAGLEILRPMSVFVLGGLVSASLLILFVLPSIYLLSGPSPESETEVLMSEPPAFEPTAA